MTALQNSAFNQLLSAWRQREEARSCDTIADLTTARLSLDSARNNMRSTLNGLR